MFPHAELIWLLIRRKDINNLNYKGVEFDSFINEVRLNNSRMYTWLISLDDEPSPEQVRGTEETLK